MLNKGSEEYRSARRSAVEVAQAILERREGICSGARTLAGAADVLVSDATTDPDFVIVVALVSETDRFPLGQARDRWESFFLKSLDAEREEVERRWEPEVMAACRSIVARFNDR